MTRVLVVEDDPACRYATTKCLMEAGYDVVAAASYLQALEMISTDDTIALLLADVVAPGGVNGFALARMARMRRSELKIMYVTAYDLPQDEALGKVLRKPVPDEQLVAEVREALAA